MEVTIKAESGTSILKPLTMTLGNYTILAGKNNSGKTSAIRALRRHFDDSGAVVIYIPAEENEPKDRVTKITAATDELYRTIEKILKPIFTSDIFKSLEEEFEKSPERKKFVDAVNSVLVGDLKVDKKKFNIKFPTEDLKIGTMVKLVRAVCNDLYDTEIDEVELENVGMGTQRMIITALIRYYAESKLQESDNVVIVIEEPEIYLHPAWKKSLHESLLQLAERDNTIVLISTHDPYFISLGRDQKIYKVFRDSNDQEFKDTTAIDPMPEKSKILGYKSDAEINFLVFDLPTPAYLMELYEELHASFSSMNMKNAARKKWILDQNVGIKTANEDDEEPRLEKTRQKLAHPKEAAQVSDEEVATGIVELTQLIGVWREQHSTPA